MRHNAQWHASSVRYDVQVGDEMEAINQQVGLALRQLRQEQGWSLDRTAQACGVSKAMLGQIERGESSPTVVTLWKIAAGLQVPFSYFLSQPAEPRVDPAGLDLYRGPRPEHTQILAEGIRVTTLLPFDPRLGYELLRVELPAGCDYLSVPHEAGAIEQVLPLDGAMDLWLAGDWQSLTVGEVLRFAADQPHGYRNPGVRAVSFHNLIHYGGLRSGSGL